MIKKITKTSSKIFFFILTLISVTIIFASLLYINLETNGFHFNKLSFGNIEIEKLDLELNEGLELNVDKLTINKAPNSRKKSFDINKFMLQTKTALLRTNKILRYINHIYIKDINYDKESMSLLYKEGKILVNSAEFAFLLKKDKEKLLNYNASFFMKKEDIKITSNIYIDAKAIKLNDLILHTKYLDANLSVALSPETYEIYINSGKILDIKKLNRYIKISNNIIEDWVFNNIKASSIEIKKAHIKLPYGAPKINDLLNITALLEYRNPVVHFVDGAKNVYDNHFFLEMKNGSLYFRFNNPKYDNRKPVSVKLSINDMFTKERELKLLLNSDSKLDKDVLEILHAYDINLPLLQKDGFLNSIVKLDINLNSGKVTPSGYFNLRSANILLKDFNFKVNSATLELTEDSVNIFKSNIDMLKGNFLINGNINYLSKKMNFHTHINNFFIKSKESYILDIKNEDMNIIGDLKEDSTWISSPLKKFKIIFADKIRIKLTDLSKIAVYSPLLKEEGISSGYVEISSKKFEDIDIVGEVGYPIRISEKESLDRLSFSANINRKGELNLSSNDGKVSLYKNDMYTQVNLKDYPLFLEPEEKNRTDDDNKKLDSSISHEFVLKGTNSPIYIKGKKIVSETYTLFTKNDFKDISIISKYKNSSIKISIKEKKEGMLINLDGINLDDYLLNTAMNREIFYKGTFDIKAKYENGILKGDMNIKDSYTSNKFTTISNIISFLDTAPTLATLSLPKFTTIGYKIKSGDVHFGYSADTLVIENMKLVGDSIDFTGSGFVDTEKSTIDMQLSLIFMKSLSNIINKIPIVGYLTLNKDGYMSTGLKVDGELDNPNIKSQIAKETITLPFNIVKKTIKAVN